MIELDLDNMELDRLLEKRDRQKIINFLRTRIEPLSVEYCKKLADFFGDDLQPIGRPKLYGGEVAYATKKWPENITIWDFVIQDVLNRMLIKDPECNEVQDSFDAKIATCKTFGISERTYDRIYAQCKKYPHFCLYNQIQKS